jgi:hypothetical protein
MNGRAASGWLRPYPSKRDGTTAALRRWVQVAVCPARRSRFHWIGANHSRIDVGTFRALETADIVPRWAIHDAGKRHAALTFWTTGALDRNESGVGTSVGFGHVMHPLIGRERNTLCHRWMPMAVR